MPSSRKKRRQGSIPTDGGNICLVITSVSCAGPHYKFPVNEPPKPPENEAVVAACQWGSREDWKNEWLKSWYFPTDAFDPWPGKTPLCCWWCTCEFDWTPFPLPYGYDLRSSRFKVNGVFCGPSCAKAYCINRSYSNTGDVFMWINSIAEKMYGYDLSSKTPGSFVKSTIMPAPPKEVLSKYCGPNGFSPEQYRNFCMCGRSLEILPPNFITLKQVVQAEQHNGTRNPIRHVEDPDNIQRTQDLVKVRRIPFAGLGAKRLSDYLKKPKS